MLSINENSLTVQIMKFESVAKLSVKLVMVIEES